jgi:hypothetical protein
LVKQAGPSHQLSIEVQHHFDPTLWQSAPLPAKPASTLLVTWTVDPEPIDAGMPPSAQALFAAALCTLGTVFYAADAEAQKAATQIAEVQIRISLRRLLLRLFRAESKNEVLPAFESGLHDWSMNAQWLIVAARTDLELDVLEPLARTLYQDWRLPTPWPESVFLIVQAGVDGDAAICHCRDREVDERLCTALRVAATDAGARFRLLNGEESSQ